MHVVAHFGSVLGVCILLCGRRCACTLAPHLWCSIAQPRAGDMKQNKHLPNSRVVVGVRVLGLGTGRQLLNVLGFGQPDIGHRTASFGLGIRRTKPRARTAHATMRNKPHGRTSALALSVSAWPSPRMVNMDLVHGLTLSSDAPNGPDVLRDWFHMWTDGIIQHASARSSTRSTSTTLFLREDNLESASSHCRKRSSTWPKAHLIQNTRIPQTRHRQPIVRSQTTRQPTGNRDPTRNLRGIHWPPPWHGRTQGFRHPRAPRHVRQPHGAPGTLLYLLCAWKNTGVCWARER